MEDPNIYLTENDSRDPRTCQVINRVLTDVLREAIECNDVDVGWHMIRAQLDFYSLSEDLDVKNTMLDDYAAAVLARYQ